MTRCLLYSHDTYGLGHFRRSSLLAEAIVEADGDSEVLIATGSPHARSFPLPERVDTVTLPSATKDGNGAYRPRKLRGSLRQLVSLRSAIISATVAAYEPEVILVDHAPLGMAGELGPLLDCVARRRGRPRMVLGVRDIIDDADRVDAEWHRCDVWNSLDRYDDIFVYGDPRIVTTAAELALSARCDAAVTHTGYVAPSMPSSTRSDPYVLVTPGGGGDGQAMLRCYLDALDVGAVAGVRSLIVTGPLMSSSRRDELLTRAQRTPSVECIEFSSEMRSLISSATGVISMAGYNTVVEELAADVPALLVPRRWPRAEQTIRAARITPHSRLQHCSVEQFDPAAIARFIDDALDCRGAAASVTDLDLGGAETVARLLTGARLTSTPRPRSTDETEQLHDCAAHDVRA